MFSLYVYRLSGPSADTGLNAYYRVRHGSFILYDDLKILKTVSLVRCQSSLNMANGISQHLLIHSKVGWRRGIEAPGLLHVLHITHTVPWCWLKLSCSQSCCARMSRLNFDQSSKIYGRIIYNGWKLEIVWVSHDSCLYLLVYSRSRQSKISK